MWVQQKLSEYVDPFTERMEGLRTEFISPNPRRYPTWRACLEGEGLLTEEAVDYSKKKGWKLE